MEAESDPIEVNPTPSKLPFKLDYRVIALIIIAVAIFGGIALLLFVVYVKVFRKKSMKDDTKKKKQKCEHKKDEPKNQISPEERVKQLDSILDDLNTQEINKKEELERERVNNVEVSTSDLTHVDENTSHEDE